MSKTQAVNARDETEGSRESQANLNAALARTATRAIALYFSRPVRLFRPSKVSGWHSLRGLASHEGSALTPGFVKSLIRDQGFMVIPKHFLPPMLVNALLGTVLWTAYAESSSVIEPYLDSYPVMIAGLSGGIAGGLQAVVAAPAENVRLLLEGGSGSYHSWSHAWKVVFKGTELQEPASRERKMKDARQVRRWMKDVGDMAGRGWNGWGWGLAKDITGFAVFFAIFDETRRVALRARELSVYFIRKAFSTEDESAARYIPKTVHGITLVSGGVIAGLAYEFTGRPWDHARRIVHVHKLQTTQNPRTPWLEVIRKFHQEGLPAFFKAPVQPHPNSDPSGGYRPRLTIALKTLGRVGPWGIGFLAWEAFGPGLTDN